MLTANDTYMCAMLTELLYPLQDGYTPLHFAARGGNTTCVEHLLTTPGIAVNIKGKVSWSIEYLRNNHLHLCTCMHMCQ